MPLNDEKMNWPQNGPDDQVRNMVAEIPQPVSSDDDLSEGGSEDEAIDPVAAAGYQLLSQDPETVPNTQAELPSQADHSTPSSILLGVSNITSQGFPIPEAPYVEHDDFILAPDEEDSTCQQPMQPEHAELVKSVMAGIQLPSSAIPRWAAEMPEDQWKAAVLSHIGKPNSSATQAEDTVSSCTHNQSADGT